MTRDGSASVIATPPDETPWHTLEPDRVLAMLETNVHDGLPDGEIPGRLEAYGPNLLGEAAPISKLSIMANQFKDFMIYILLAAVVVSGAVLREALDAVVILAIVIANAVLGFIQEYRAERALVALKELGAPTARVLRSGMLQVIAARELVPGDLVLLEAGDLVPADGRLVEAHSFEVNESALTGESESVEKSTATLSDADLLPGDRLNMVFLGTHVVRGRGRAVVVATGMTTQMGEIAQLLEKTEATTTPLQRELHTTGKRIAVLCLAISAVIFVVGALRGLELAAMFLFAVSLAVAAIPEGMPAIVTIVLALGVQSLAKHHALLRRLHAVETLGSADVICTDKTGTLTRAEMEVREWVLPAREQQLTDPGAESLFVAASLCNDAREQEGRYIGDSTEVALVQAAERLDLNRERLAGELPRVDEIPFESERKMMSTLHQVAAADLRESLFPAAGAPPYILFTKGAPEAVLGRSAWILAPGGLELLSEDERQRLEKQGEDMAGRALRTLAMAYRPLDTLPAGTEPLDVERDLVFLGLVGMSDPPRPEVFAALATCREAQIDVVMITGDHAVTAEAIGKELGILAAGRRLMKGEELERIAPEELAEQVEDIGVYARVSPAHKVKIVEAWKSRGYVVAMTGDGVNDAPALKRADIGIAMGITGTHVSKEAADMVLTDDNFATIVRAVREGRAIFANLKKFIYFLLSCNISEVVTMFIAMLVESATPLRAVQVLWINLVTDGFPAMALGVDKPEPGLMQQAPRDPEEDILSWRRQRTVLGQGAVLSAGALASFFLAVYALGFKPGDSTDLKSIQTIVFTTLVFAQLFHTLNFHSSRLSFFRANPFVNRALVVALAVSFAMQFLVILVPPVMRAFGTTYLGLDGWLVVLGSSIIPVLLIDRLKVITARYSRAKTSRY